jgi:hypothetical protein
MRSQDDFQASSLVELGLEIAEAGYPVYLCLHESGRKLFNFDKDPPTTDPKYISHTFEKTYTEATGIGVIDPTDGELLTVVNIKDSDSVDWIRQHIAANAPAGRQDEKPQAKANGSAERVTDFIRNSHKRANGDEQFEDEPRAKDEEPRTGGEQRQEAKPPPPPPLEVFDAGDDVDLPPPRAWLLGNSFARKFLSSLFADGGVGKTALRYAQLIALAAGRPITGEHVFQRCRVLIVSLEDDRDELQRRVEAVLRHHGIDRSETKGWLFYATPGAAAGKLMMSGKFGTLIRGKLAASIEAVVAARGIDIVSIDPFVKSHSVEENSNSAIDDVVQVLTDLMTKYNIAVDVPHHVAKAADTAAGNANRGRGASAMKDAGRLIYTLTSMSSDEAKAFGIPEQDRRLYIRIDSAKVNILRPSIAAKWFHLVGIPLGNTSELYPSGDNVQTVEVWKPPGAFDNVTVEHQHTVHAKAAGGKYAYDHRATGIWIGEIIAEVTGLDAGEQRALIQRILDEWIKTGVLKKVSRNEGKGTNYRERWFVEPGDPPVGDEM